MRRIKTKIASEGQKEGLGLAIIELEQEEGELPLIVLEEILEKFPNSTYLLIKCEATALKFSKEVEVSKLLELLKLKIKESIKVENWSSSIEILFSDQHNFEYFEKYLTTLKPHENISKEQFDYLITSI